jgi:hypothetical protein
MGGLNEAVIGPFYFSNSIVREFLGGLSLKELGVEEVKTRNPFFSLRGNGFLVKVKLQSSLPLLRTQN